MERARAAHLGPELRRPLLLDAALPLFAHDGYEAVSVQAIADAAGVSKPVLYSCFAGKGELFDALMRREERTLWQVVQEAMPPPGAGGDREVLLARALAALLSAARDAPDTFRVIYLQRPGETRIERGRRRWEVRMAEVLVGLGAAGSTAPREVALLGRTLVATAELGLRITLEEPGRWAPDELAAYLARLVVHGLCATP